MTTNSPAVGRYLLKVKYVYTTDIIPLHDTQLFQELFHNFLVHQVFEYKTSLFMLRLRWTAVEPQVYSTTSTLNESQFKEACDAALVFATARLFEALPALQGKFRANSDLMKYIS